jgi:hypothetical protein
MLRLVSIPGQGWAFVCNGRVVKLRVSETVYFMFRRTAEFHARRAGLGVDRNTGLCYIIADANASDQLSFEDDTNPEREVAA